MNILKHECFSIDLNGIIHMLKVKQVLKYLVESGILG